MLDGSDPLILIHVVSALLAIVAGAVVFALPKGTRTHRRVAWLYVAAMIVTTTVVAFVPATVLRFGDSGFGFFHLFILVGLASSTLGIYGLYRWRRTRDRRWLRAHQMRFAFSYAGLLMAGFSQVFTNPRFGIISGLTPATFWFVFVGANAAMLGVAIYVVQRYLAHGDPLRRYALRASPPAA